MPEPTFGDLLDGGDRRSHGRAATVLALLRQSPRRTAELIPLLRSPDPRVAMRASDVLEKFSRGFPAAIQPYRRQLLADLHRTTQHEVQWHLALLLPRLTLTPTQQLRVLDGLEAYLDAPGSIVRALALQGMADLTQRAPLLWPRVERHLRHATTHGTPAMKARARLLLKAAARRHQRGITTA